MFVFFQIQTKCFDSHLSANKKHQIPKENDETLKNRLEINTIYFLTVLSVRKVLESAATILLINRTYVSKN